MGAVSLLAGSWLLQALGPRSSRGAGPPQAPWASAGHSTQAVNTVCVSMVCVRMVCVSTPSRNLASPETVQYRYTTQGHLILHRHHRALAVWLRSDSQHTSDRRCCATYAADADAPPLARRGV